ncbi:MAG TPA: butyrate kinase [Clostridiales bacterium UBA8153]|nr:butyrate kinase [Clostridiales bacterium UBA8153]
MVLVVNPGSTSTKLALCSRTEVLQVRKVDHTSAQLQAFPTVVSQLPWRLELVREFVDGRENALAAVVGLGGLLSPVAGGTYRVNEKLRAELAAGTWGEHASNLGGLLAHAVAAPLAVPAYIVDPVVVDELVDRARVSGWPAIQRRSVFHALNQKAVARRAAAELGRSYGELALLVAHLGGGITVGAHRDGRVIDVNNGLDGEGPFSPERCGTLPVTGLVRRVAQGRDQVAELWPRVAGRGGLVDHLGTSDAREVEARIDSGDAQARLVYEAMAYQVAKELGRAAASVGRLADALILTGGLAHSRYFTGLILPRVSWLAGTVLVYPGEDEIQALNAGAWRVLDGAEGALEYA